MGRRPRIDAPGTWHHVMNRGAARRDIFRDEPDRELFTDLLGTLDVRFGLETHAYCLMGNHYHLLVRSARGELSAAMRLFGAMYTRRTNERHGVDGPVFRGRFHSVLLDSHEHLVRLVRYVHRNPLDIGWDRPLHGYLWSSHAAYLGLAPPPWWLHQRVVLDFFGGHVERYRTFVDEDDLAVDDPVGFRAGEQARGRRDHQRRAAASRAEEGDALRTVTTAGDPHGWGPRGSPTRAPNVDDVLTTVAELADACPDAVRAGGRGRRNDARLVAVFVASRTSRLDASDLAQVLGFSSASGVRTAIARAQTLVESDETVRAIADTAIRRLGDRQEDDSAGSVRVGATAA